jgi:hypothetical protein
VCIDKKFLVVCVVLIYSGIVLGADVILNEYNAVGGTDFLNGGTAAVDIDGGRASDIYFGRLQGNGGDWFELVVITDHLNMQSWRLDIYENGSLDETLNLTNHSIWSDLRSGTIITVSEDLPSDISYNPAAGDWWINVQANNIANGLYIEASNFVVSSSNWQIRIRNSAGVVIFGPAGEGISPASGISNTEIFRLEADPSASITPASADYDDGKDFSTFGAPNRWGIQSFGTLRAVVAPETSSITLLTPNGSEIVKAGNTYLVTWQSVGSIANVLVEFSTDNGNGWSEVYPPNAGNTGSYNWLVPMIDTEQCLVRVASVTNLAVNDTSNNVFTIYGCPVIGDMDGDCRVNLFDFAIIASYWLQCGNPYDPNCP